METPEHEKAGYKDKELFDRVVKMRNNCRRQFKECTEVDAAVSPGVHPVRNYANLTDAALKLIQERQPDPIGVSFILASIVAAAIEMYNEKGNEHQRPVLPEERPAA